MLFAVATDQIQRKNRAPRKRKRRTSCCSTHSFTRRTAAASIVLLILTATITFAQLALLSPKLSFSGSSYPLLFSAGVVEAFHLHVASIRRPSSSSPSSRNWNSILWNKGKSRSKRPPWSFRLAQYADNRDSSSDNQFDNDWRQQGQQIQQQKRRSRPHQESSTNSRRRGRPNKHGENRRTQQQQLQWILNTVMAAQQRQREWNNNKHADERRRVTTAVVVSDDLVSALKRLVRAKTTHQVSEAGRQLETAIDWIWQQEQQQQNQQDKSRLFWEIQERLVKATSMTGLLNLSLNITNRMLQAGHLPSFMAQDALCSSLRRAGKLERLQELILQLGAVAITHQQQHQRQQQQQDGHEDQRPVREEEEDYELPARGVSLSAFNSYLAAMCDVATDNKKRNHRISRSSPRSVFRNEKSTATLMEECWRWISSCSNDDDAEAACVAQLGVEPDDVSFATVLQAASSIGNETLTTLLWDEMYRHRIQPNIVAYNARLRMAIKSSSQTLVERDESVLAIWQDEIQRDANVQPDRYTIDLLLLPLTRQGRIGQVQDLLDDFILEHRGYSAGSSGAQQQRQEGVVSSAFSSFFKTLVQGGEVAMARNLFDTYILPAIRSPALVDPNVEQTQLSVLPTTKHFNVLLSGYRELLQQQQDQERKQSEANENDTVGAIERSDGTDFQKCAYDDGWRLFELMQSHTSLSIQPDAFTFTSMMGLCSTPSELSSLLHLAVNRHGVYCASAVLRAAMTTFGEMGDASSACWLFAKFACPFRLAPSPVSYNQRMECQPASLREWNVLLGALARSAEKNATRPIDIGGAQVAQTMSTSTYPAGVPSSSASTALSTISHPFTLMVNQSTCSEAAGVILDAMTAENAFKTAEATNIAFRLPKPNSQSYCLVATALQHSTETTITNTTMAKSDEALMLFNKAMDAGVPADGRFLNAIFRCFGPDIKAALQAWKTQIRPACLAHENRRRSRPPSARRKQGKNLVAAYHGLLYCCGRAQRADMALRVVYAMTKEGLEPTETALNVYQAGKRQQNELIQEEGTAGKRASSLLARKLRLIDPYESLLYVECTKYNPADQRRADEKRVRIIV